MASLSFCYLDANAPSCLHHSLAGWHRAGVFFFFPFLRTVGWPAVMSGSHGISLPSVPLYFPLFNEVRIYCSVRWDGSVVRRGTSMGTFYQDIYWVISWVIIYLLGHLDWRTGNWTAGPGGDTHTYIKGRGLKLGKIFSQTRIGRESLSLCVELIMIIPIMMRYEKNQMR
jgi:hypothetical protein